MEADVLKVELEGVVSKEYNTKTDLKICSRKDMEQDEDLKYIYIIKEGPVILPAIYVRKDNKLYNIGYDVCEILNKK